MPNAFCGPWPEAKPIRIPEEITASATSTASIRNRKDVDIKNALQIYVAGKKDIVTLL